MVKGKAVDRHVREEIVAHQILGRNARETRRLLWGPLCGMKSVPCLRSIYRVRRIWRTYGIVGISKHRSLGRGARGLSATVACIIRAWCRKPGGKRRGTRLSKLRKFLQMNPVVNRSVPRCTLCRWLKRLGLTRKKGTRVALQQDPVKVALFWTKLQLLDVDVDEAVFFDESGINTDDWNTYHPQANPCENLFGNIKHNLPEYRDELEELAIRPRVAMLLRIFKSCAGNGNCKRWASLCGYYTNLG
jgi:transposase